MSGVPLPENGQGLFRARSLTLLAACALLALAGYRFRIGAPAADEARASSVHRNNSTWVQSAPFRGFRTKDKTAFTEKDVVRLAATLRENAIKYAYVFAGPYDESGALPDFAFSETARQAVEVLKREYPDLLVLPWIGGVQGKSVFLERQEWRERALEEADRLMKTLKVDGVHFDFEHILPEAEYVIKMKGLTGPRLSESRYTEQFVSFLAAARSRFPKAFLSTVVPSTVEGISSWKQALPVREVSKLAAYADQVAIIFYDTGIHDKALFERSLAAQLEHLRELKDDSANSRTQFLLGVGTFENEPELRRLRSLEIEAIPNYYSTLNRAARGIGEVESLLDGAAVYCEWETSAEEWTLFRENWVELLT